MHGPVHEHLGRLAASDNIVDKLFREIEDTTEDIEDQIEEKIGEVQKTGTANGTYNVACHVIPIVLAAVVFTIL